MLRRPDALLAAGAFQPFIAIAPDAAAGIAGVKKTSFLLNAELPQGANNPEHSAFPATAILQPPSPMHKTILHYNKPLVLQAVRGFWWRVVGFRFIGALALVAVGLVGSLRSGDRSWVVGVLGSVLFFAIAFVVALYVVHYRNALYKLKALGSQQTTLDVSETSLSLSSGAGTATLPWSAVSEVWRFKTCWLLVLSKSQFVTLPLASLPPELAEFLLARVRASGGQVS